MKPLHYLIYGLLIFSPYFLREDIVGADPYFYLNRVCMGTDYNIDARPADLFETIIPYFPCDILIIKGILLILFLTSLYIIQHIGKIYGQNNTALLTLLSPLLLLEFLKFENEAFAIPLLLAGTYYFLKWKYKFKGTARSLEEWDLWGSITYFCIGLAIWKGGFIYLVALLFPYSLIPTAIYLYFVDGNMITQFLPNLLNETAPFQIITIAFLFLGLLSMQKEIKVQTIFFTILGIIQNRFLVHSTPFLAIGMENRLNKKYGGIRKFLYFIPFIWIIAIFTFPPLTGDWEIIDYSIDLSEKTELTLYNDFGLGYWLHSKGYNTPYYGWSQEIKLIRPGLMLTYKEMEECKLIERKNKLMLYLCE